MTSLSKANHWLRPFYVPALLLVGWELLSRVSVSFRYAFVPVREISTGLFEILTNGQLLENLLASLQTTVTGLVIGSMLGLLLGSLMGVSRIVHDIVGPLFNAWRPVPTLGFIPLIALWFGSGELSKIVIVVLAAFEPMVLNTYEGLRDSDSKHREVGELFRFNRRQLFFSVQLPSALPMIITGVLHALGFAWIATIGCELLFTVGPGLGGLMEHAQMAGRMDIIILCVASIGIVGLLMNLLVEWVARRLLRWRNA
jgi:sulfonate transport system permease protein